MNRSQLKHFVKPPDRNLLINLSGGRTSAYMLYWFLQANDGLPGNTVVSFQNTGKEWNETLDFVHRIETEWKVPVVWLQYKYEKPLFEVVDYHTACRLSDAHSPFDDILKKRQYWLPRGLHEGGRYCTMELKILTSKRYLWRVHGWKKWHGMLGIRHDERHRCKYGEFHRRTPIYPLVEAQIAKTDIDAFWRKHPFDLELPKLGDVDTCESNCAVCFLKSDRYIGLVSKFRPDAFEWWQNQETDHNEGKYTWKNGVSLARIAEIANSQTSLAFGQGGAPGLLCQAGDGECTG